MAGREHRLQEDRETIGKALGRIPSGCSILTASHEEDRTGTLVSWVQQASFEPLAVSVCLKPDRPVVPLIERSGRFLLNVIGEDPSHLFKHFGKGFPPGADAFAGLEIWETPYGPALAEAVAHLGCRVRERVRAGDHDLFVAEVLAGAAGEGGAGKPYVHLRATGLTY